MAVFNEIGIGRWNRFIQKLCDMKGGPPARQLSSEIVFSHPIFHGSENRYLESWQRFGLAFFVSAVAANTSGMKLRNPAGSNVIAVLEKLLLSNSTGALSLQSVAGPGPSGPDLATINAIAQRFDPRGQLNPTLISSQQNTTPAIAFVANTICQVLTPPNTVNPNYDIITTENQEIPILPGEAVLVFSPNVNQQVSGSIFWRERFLEPAERF